MIHVKEAQHLHGNAHKPVLVIVSLDIEMDDFEQDGINEEFIEYAIQESIQDAYKLPSSIQTNR